MPPISLGIGLSLTMQSRGGRAWTPPAGYAALRFKDENGSYRSVIYRTNAGSYRPLAYKKEV